MFNHRTSINIENRIVSFDIKELGKQLKKIEQQKVDPDTKLPLRDENGDCLLYTSRCV